MGKPKIYREDYQTSQVVSQKFFAIASEKFSKQLDEAILIGAKQWIKQYGIECLPSSMFHQDLKELIEIAEDHGSPISFVASRKRTGIFYSTFENERAIGKLKLSKKFEPPDNDRWFPSEISKDDYLKTHLERLEAYVNRIEDLCQEKGMQLIRNPLVSSVHMEWLCYRIFSGMSFQTIANEHGIEKQSVQEACKQLCDEMMIKLIPLKSGRKRK